MDSTGQYVASYVWTFPERRDFPSILVGCPGRTTTNMNALSRREEETLLKTTKARALKECDSVVRGNHYCWFILDPTELY